MLRSVAYTPVVMKKEIFESVKISKKCELWKKDIEL